MQKIVPAPGAEAPDCRSVSVASGHSLGECLGIGIDVVAVDFPVTDGEHIDHVPFDQMAVLPVSPFAPAEVDDLRGCADRAHNADLDDIQTGSDDVEETVESILA